MPNCAYAHERRLTENGQRFAHSDGRPLLGLTSATEGPQQGLIYWKYW
jgi:hypothetical protein